MTQQTNQKQNRKTVNYIVGSSGKATSGLIKIHFKGVVGVMK